MPVVLGGRPDEQSLTSWEMRGTEYVERAHVTCDETFETNTPFPLTIAPAQLVD